MAENQNYFLNLISTGGFSALFNSRHTFSRTKSAVINVIISDSAIKKRYTNALFFVSYQSR